MTGGVWGCVCDDVEDSLGASCGWVIGHSGKGCGGTTPVPSITCIVVSFDPGAVASQAMDTLGLGRIFIFSLVLVFGGGWFGVLSSLKFFLPLLVPQ